MKQKRNQPSNDIKKYNKYYSTASELIENVNLNELLSQFDESMTLVEPFAGDCDLLNMFKDDLIKSKNIALIELYDITEIDDSKIKSLDSKVFIDKFTHHDSLENLVFKTDNAPYIIITNPPYTAKNKLDKEMKAKYERFMTDGIQDLYQIFIKQFIDNSNLINCGCIIIPTNFMFGSQSKKLRNQFLNKFDYAI